MIVDRYYYAQLNKQEQAVYKAFYNGLMAHEDVIPIPIKGQLSKEVFNKIFRAMTRDNPLIYYVNQSACNWATDAFGYDDGVFTRLQDFLLKFMVQYL